jgi:predicted PurR-regulated permease PerM
VTAGERRAGLFWLAAFAALLLVLHLLSGILLPFVAGCGIAYFLDPAADRLEAWRVPRALAAAVVLLLFFLALVVILLLLLPMIELEATELARRAPLIVEFGQQRVQALTDLAQQKLSPEDLAKLKDMAGGWAATAIGWAAQLLQQVLTGGLALANLLSLIIVTPVVAFFLLRDWDRLIALIDSWLPRRHVATIRAQARLVDATLAGFVHGQVLVGLVLAIYYAAALSLVGLTFAVILAIIIGILSFIPFVGVVTGLLLALGLGLVQFGATSKLLAVIAIFAAGHLVESNFLSPRLVGKRIHLHPVWVIFALLAFGSLFGFLGVLLALPAAAVIGVLARFAVARYLASPLYDPASRPPDGEG